MSKVTLPISVAISPDGNRRWAAQKNGLNKLAGHVAGAEKVNDIHILSNALGIKYLTIYVLSNENILKRSRDEVQGLSELMVNFVKTFESKLPGKVKVIGDIEILPDAFKYEIKKAEEITSQRKGTQLTLCYNYGGRAEIIKALQTVKELDLELNETSISNCFYTAGIPDPDLHIRTGGEKRLSNFLLWQMSYTELYFTDVLWPDFEGHNYLLALDDYQNRKRNFGG